MKEKVPSGILMAYLSCLIMMIVDPLFFYIELINAHKKCIVFDKKMEIIGSIILRSISDFFCLIYITIPCGNTSRKLRSPWFLFCVLCNLPVHQVLISLVFTQRITGSSIDSALQIIILQICLRSVLTITFTVGTSVSGIGRGSWVFFLVYPYCAHFAGGIWYQTALNEVISCWMLACIDTGCHIGYYFIENSPYCDESSNNKMQNTTISCNLGLYDDFLKYNLGEVTDFPRKLFFCLRWALQSLSCFGQNLQPNGTFSQNFFAIMMSVMGVSLFTVYIALMQMKMQSVQERKEKRKRKIKQLENSKPFRKLSKNLQLLVKERKSASIWQEITHTKGVDVVNLLRNLSEGLTAEIKRDLCLKMLKKVEQFGRWGDALLKELCKYVKPVSYAEYTYIVRDKESIDEMLFLVQGELRTYSFRSVDIGSTSIARCRSITNILRAGEFYGEELVAWFQADPYSYDLPISTKSVRTLTKVDGFTLSADTLRILIIKHHKAVFIQAYWRFTMIKMHQTVGGQTSTQDQTPPTESKPQLSLEISVQQP